jgi:cytochrome c biogenesis protein CcmG, thiol:disulfide interchange protein DsbE
LIAQHTGKLRKARPALAAAALIACVAASVTARAEAQLKEPAPPLTVETLGADKFDLAAMRGKVVLVDFWASWCAPCLAEFPAIAKFYKKHREEGFEVIALSVDRPSARSKMVRIAETLPFPAALLSEATANGFGKPKAVPVSFLIDAKGVVRGSFISIDSEVLGAAAAPLIQEAQAQRKGQ